MQDDTIVYKICSRADWEAACVTGFYTGSADDARDGFIHFSAGHQTAATADKYFHGQRDLVVVGVAVSRLGPALEWEPSRGGDLFPHLHGPLDVTAAVSVTDLPLDPSGRPVVPGDLAR